MTGLLIATIFVTSFYTPEDERKDLDKDTYVKSHHQEVHDNFNAFRRQYLAVYLVIMLADWMQGTHMYTLYLSYNVNISALFLTGFLSGAIFAPFLGSAVDKFGRKRSCIVYCVLEIIINLMEHSTDFQLLLLGRVLGGVSTNLLFSAFESWMTTEHRHRGFPEEWLTRTYAEVCLSYCITVLLVIVVLDDGIVISWSFYLKDYCDTHHSHFSLKLSQQTSIGNGLMAILAGIVAQVLEDYLGHIGPFQGAIALTALALVMILPWNENYGEKKEGEHSTSSLYHQFTEGWKVTMSDARVWKIGMTQALSEGAMYTVRYCMIGQVVLYRYGITHLFNHYAVCIHVGTHIVTAGSTRWGSHWLRLFGTHDEYYHGRSHVSAVAVVCGKFDWIDSKRNGSVGVIGVLAVQYQHGDSCHVFTESAESSSWRLPRTSHCKLCRGGVLCRFVHASRWNAAIQVCARCIAGRYFEHFSIASQYSGGSRDICY